MPKNAPKNDTDFGMNHEKSKAHVAVVDDDDAVLDYLSVFLKSLGLTATVFRTAEEAWRVIEKDQSVFDLILADVHLPGMTGIDLLKTVRKVNSDLLVILISAQVRVKDAVLGIKAGAYDYVEKPFDPDRLEIVVRNALKLHAARKEAFLSRQIKIPGVQCQSPSMRVIYEVILRSASADSNVLVTGETGVGKELVARAIHDNSVRAHHPFVTINCSAIPETLLESELFGHAKGSFTGATSDRAGLFSEANNGTLFLDEIGDLNPLMQVKLLRVIQEREVRPVGSNRSHSVNVRLVTATNRNLPAAVKDGKFREDLFYRLNVIPIHVPPLRQRRDDIGVLAEYFLKSTCSNLKIPPKKLSHQALEKLIHMRFPGNVRELQNIVERSVVFSDSAVINEWDIGTPDDTGGVLEELAQEMPKLDELEHRYVRSILERHSGDKQAVAKILGVSKRTVYRRLEMAQKAAQRTTGGTTVALKKNEATGQFNG